jgi:hypothetical protein
MSPKPRRPKGTNKRILVLVIAVGALTLVLAVAAVSTWMSGRGPAPAPAGAALPAAAPPAPTPDPRVVAAELVGLAPELTPASAEMLAREVPGASGSMLAEMGLLFASRGFDLMPREELLELGRLYEEVYATLPPADRDWMGQYMRSVRDGSLTAESSVRGRQLLTQGVNLLAPERRLRLQALVEKAIRSGIEARRKAEGRTPPEATPAAGPMQPFQPPPPNSLAPDTGMVPGPSPSASGPPGPRDEAYWRKRMEEARAKVARLKQQVDVLDRIARQNTGSSSQAVQQQRVEQITKLRGELGAAEKALVDLEEEARRAGALPGWLRE